MRALIVGSTIRPTEEMRRAIIEVSPDIRLLDLSKLCRDESDSREARQSLDKALAEVEVLFVGGTPQSLPARAPRLKWVQFVGTGVDRLQKAGLFHQSFTITNVTGTNALPIAEHCFAFMLNFVKRTKLALESQSRHDYNRPPLRPDFLEGKTLGVLGLGGIGLETARLGKAFRMCVLGMRRSAVEHQQQVGDLDELYPTSMLHELLERSDFVVDALPLTPETMHVLGAPEFKIMKQTAYLINVGRGPQIDETALVEALKSGEIAGAGLDVFEEEPLPETSELWALDNVLITPHVAGDLIDNRERATRFFADNLRRYIGGEALENVIDPDRGY